MGKISNSTLNKVLLRTQGCQFAHNYERMQSLSLTYCFAPVLEELYKDAPKEERVNAMKRHLEYFNTHPLAIPFILGITAALEETTDEDQKDTVVGIKTSLMGPFAGLGDSLLNLTWFPIAGSIGASMCVDNGSIVGPLVMFLLINLLYWPLKYFGLHKGYEMGMELVEKAGVQVFDRLGNLANVLGVMPTDATRGMMIGAITALPPVRVLSTRTITIEVSIEARIALFMELMPTLRTIKYTKFSATPDSLRIAPRPEPIMMIKPTWPRNEPSDVDRILPNVIGLVFVRTMPMTIQIITLTRGWISFRNARMM